MVNTSSLARALKQRLRLTGNLIGLLSGFAIVVCANTRALPLAMAQSTFLETDAAKDLPDFSYAGYAFGLVEPPNLKGAVVDVTEFGAVANDGKDDSQAVLEALNAAHSVQGPVVVTLPQGRLVLSEILPIERSNIVIRGVGSGNGGTELHFPRPLVAVDNSTRLDELRSYLKKYDKRQREPDRNLDELFSEYSWSGGFFWIQKPGTRAASYLEEYDPPISRLAAILEGKRGASEVLVDTSSGLRTGDALQIHWFNQDGENGPLLKEIYGDTELAIGSHHWSFPGRPLVRQTTRIKAINGNRVTIGDPLLHNISDVIPAQFSEWEHVEQVGLEDFAITFPQSPFFGHHQERGYNGVYVTSVIDGWVRDVRIENADSGILTYNSANLTIENIRTQGDRMAHYAVHLGNVHNVLVRDVLIENPVLHSLTFNTQSTKSVFQRARVLKAAVLDQHAGSNHQNLFDNVTLHIQADRKQGSPFYSVWDGSGAGYWQPGHGRFNTTWNLNVIVESGAARGETVMLEGVEEGPDAFIVGVHGNRELAVDYRPAPRALAVNSEPSIRSLYDYQLAQRRK